MLDDFQCSIFLYFILQCYQQCSILNQYRQLFHYSGTVSWEVATISQPQVPTKIVKYNVSFIKPFLNTPTIGFGNQIIKHCPSDNQHYLLSVHQFIQVKLSYFIIKSSVHTSFWNDVNMILEFSYFAINTNKNKHVQLRKGSFYYAPPTGNKQLFFANSWVNDPSNFIGCFFVTIYCQKIVNIPYTFSASCTRTSDKTLTFTTTANSVAASGSAFMTSIFFGIAIKIEHSFTFFTGFLQQIKQSPTNSLIFDKNRQSSAYFIGLVSFSSLSGCLNLALNDDKLSISENSQHKYIKYQYMYMYQAHISKIICYPFSSFINFIFDGFDEFTPIPSSSIFSSSLSAISFNTNTLQTKLNSAISSSKIIMNFTMRNQFLNKQYQLDFHFKIITLNRLTIKYHQNSALLSIINIDQTQSQSNFKIFDSRIVFFLESSGNPTSIKLIYQNSFVNNQFNITYQNNFGDIKSVIHLIIPLMTSTYSSILSTNANCSWIINNQQISNNIIYNVLTIQTSQFSIINKPQSPISSFTLYLQFMLITVKSMQITINHNIFKLVFINIPNPNSASISQFTATLPNYKINSLQIINNQVCVQVQYSNYSNNIDFSVSYLSDSKLQACTTDLKTQSMFLYFTFDIFRHQINFTFSNANMGTIIDSFQFNGSDIVNQTISILGSIIVISAKYIKSIDRNWVSISFDNDPSTIYYEITKLQLQKQNQFIIYCVDPFIKNTKQFKNMSISLVFMYWIVFFLSMVFCQKIYAVQLLFVLQFTYMTLIQIGIYCPPFQSLSFLKYSFGWNGINLPLIQKNINMYYSVSGLQSNFISNFNFMIIPLVTCPIIYVILTKLGNYSTHFKAKPRLITYGKTFLFQIPLTIILINIPNICISTIISLQYFKASTNIVSFASSIIIIILIVITMITFVIFKKQFRQYRNEFSDRHQICSISIDKSTKIKRLYPVLLFIQIVTISCVLGVQNLFGFSLFISLAIFIFNSVIIFIIAPYKGAIDNIRLFIHRFNLIVVCCLQIGFKVMRKQSSQKNNFVYQYPWILLIYLLLICLVFNLPYLIFKCIAWVKSKGIIDVSLCNKRKGRIQRLYYPNKPIKPGCFYPALQYSMHPTKQIQKQQYQQCQQRKELLKIQQINTNDVDQPQQMKWEQNLILNQDIFQ